MYWHALFSVSLVFILHSLVIQPSVEAMIKSDRSAVSVAVGIGAILVSAGLFVALESTWMGVRGECPRRVGPDKVLEPWSEYLPRLVTSTSVRSTPYFAYYIGFMVLAMIPAMLRHPIGKLYTGFPGRLAAGLLVSGAFSISPC